MRIYPAPHYTMGGLWVDYNLMTTVPGLFALGEANFSDHGANRLGASALMQGLADGYFVLPYTIGGFLATDKSGRVDTDHAAFADAENDAKARIEKIMGVGGKTPSDVFHRKLGRMMWEHCGMSRTAEGLEGLLNQIRELREQFWTDVRVTGEAESYNQSLERAGRVADYLEFAEMMAIDARDRNESCGGHFREEHQTEEGGAKRDDENYRYVAAWEYQGVGERPKLHKEPLEFEYVKLTQRSYK